MAGHKTDGQIATFNTRFISPSTCLSESTTASIDYEEIWDRALLTESIKPERRTQLSLSVVLEHKQIMSTNMVMMLPVSSIYVLSTPLMAHQFWLEHWVCGMGDATFLKTEPLCISVNECKGAFKQAMCKRFKIIVTPLEKVILVLQMAFNMLDEDGQSSDSGDNILGYVSYEGYLCNVFYGTSFVDDGEVWPSQLSQDVVKLYRRDDLSLHSLISDGKKKLFYIQALVPTHHHGIIVAHGENLRAVISTAFYTGGLDCSEASDYYIENLLHASETWIKKWYSGSQAEKITKLFQYILPYLLQRGGNWDEEEADIFSNVASVWLSAFTIPTESGSNWRSHDKCLFQIRDLLSKGEDDLVQDSIATLVSTIGDEGVIEMLNDIIQGEKPRPYDVPNEMIQYQTPNEAYEVGSPHWDFTYMNARTEHILLPDEDEENEETTIPDGSISDGSGTEGEGRREMSSHGETDEVDSEEENSGEALPINRQTAIHADASLPRYGALLRKSNEGCVKVIPGQGAPIAKGTVRGFHKAVILNGDLQGLAVKIMIVDSAAQARLNLTGLVHDGMGRNLRGSGNKTMKLLNEFVSDHVRDNNLGGEQQRWNELGLDVAVNLFLSGECGELATRWALEAIFSKHIPVSYSSTVSYIHSSIHQGDGIQIWTKLARELVSELPVLVPLPADSGDGDGVEGHRDGTISVQNLESMISVGAEVTGGARTFIQVCEDFPLLEVSMRGGLLFCVETTADPDNRIYRKGILGFQRPLQ